ncbi:hypothetical protein TrRE_jg3015 [Triparma retinervis]|uniref:DNA replication complex GINS protein PSF2 N-terminal domain-containing protein n=1 Tax=Triparma retinervis TaxID=2557542 RepID=A0A9W7FW37_9STRA|nr:hypothetical protein TrRE_jg3015 [Triparma retinervis]
MMDFLSGSTPITIIPAFDCAQLSFISGDYGPFVATMPITVPLWLGLSLRQTKRCRILPPPWMNTSFLQSVLAYEKNPSNEAFFTSAPNPQNPTGPEIPLPYYYQEIAAALLSAASPDFPSPKSLPPLLSDVEFLRSSKSTGVLKRLSHTLESRSGSFADGAPDVVYNMQSGWKSQEVQVFKGYLAVVSNASLSPSLIMFPASQFSGESGLGSERREATAWTEVRRDQAGDQASLRRSRHISPVDEDMLGWNIGVRKAILGGDRG